MDTVRHILATMDTIGLEQMNACALMNRVDTKYVFGVDHLSSILESIAFDYQVLNVGSSALSQYETLYFDTRDHQCYLQHHNGKLNRHKYRMRRYVASGLCFLEVKTKNNKGRTKKERVAVDNIEPTLSPSSLEYLREFIGADTNLLPQLWCEFWRITLVALERQERTTLDVGLVFSHDGKRYELPDIVIAEVKQPKLDRCSPIRTAFKRQGVQEMRVSKYCLGCIYLKPYLKHNRFKTKLNAIHKIAYREAQDGNI